jgi:hypothetical protein
VSDRTPEPPAKGRHTPTDAAAAPMQAGPPPTAGPPASADPSADPTHSVADETTLPEADQRPSGALAITAFLVVAILVSWFGMYALNVVRN